MSKSIVQISTRLLFTMMLFVVMSFWSGVVFAEEELIGSDEFRISCVSCHGVGGRGDGGMAKFLTVKPTDLTMLSMNNGGQYPGIKAGSYPFRRVFDIVDGRTVVSGHGDRAMPVWGSRYLSEASGKFGPYGGAYEKVVRARVLELVYYIQSIQQ
ncbi:MAG: cytochrome c [Gammaproteobacteria bacterium]|nr:cytochrome c [Gammaproteobacteria bacterium]